jgi:type IV pilus assembly protein PilP
MNNNLRTDYVRLINGFGIGIVCFALSGCGDNDFTDLEQKIAEIKAKPKGKIEPLPPAKTTEPFSFQLDGSRDPFKAVEKDTGDGEGETPDNGVKPDPTRVKEDLESFSLDSLKMVGTLKDATTLWGLVQSGQGIVYRVKVGNYMGFNDGKITDVSNDEIKLTEIILDKTSNKERKRYNEQPASLKLVATE